MSKKEIVERRGMESGVAPDASDGEFDSARDSVNSPPSLKSGTYTPSRSSSLFRRLRDQYKDELKDSATSETLKSGMSRILCSKRELSFATDQATMEHVDRMQSPLEVFEFSGSSDSDVLNDEAVEGILRRLESTQSSLARIGTLQALLRGFLVAESRSYFVENSTALMLTMRGSKTGNDPALLFLEGLVIHCLFYDPRTIRNLFCDPKTGMRLLPTIIGILTEFNSFNLARLQSDNPWIEKYFSLVAQINPRPEWACVPRDCVGLVTLCYIAHSSPYARRVMRIAGALSACFASIAIPETVERQLYFYIRIIESCAKEDTENQSFLLEQTPPLPSLLAAVFRRRFDPGTGRCVFSQDFIRIWDVSFKALVNLTNENEAAASIFAVEDFDAFFLVCSSLAELVTRRSLSRAEMDVLMHAIGLFTNVCEVSSSQSHVFAAVSVHHELRRGIFSSSSTALIFLTKLFVEFNGRCSSENRTLEDHFLLSYVAVLLGLQMKQSPRSHDAVCRALLPLSSQSIVNALLEFLGMLTKGGAVSRSVVASMTDVISFLQKS